MAQAMDTENILSDHGLPVYNHDILTFPCYCDLCWYVIEGSDDDLMWHGYGNCVEISDEMWEQWKREAIAADVDDYGTSGRSDK